jgi:hypothetical protein
VGARGVITGRKTAITKTPTISSISIGLSIIIVSSSSGGSVNRSSRYNNTSDSKSIVSGTVDAIN